MNTNEGTPYLDSDADEKLLSNPLKTNLSVTAIDILLIEDGIKSSKERQTFSDGRELPLGGGEIYNSRPKQQSTNQT
jgi:hypothetical protein